MKKFIYAAFVLSLCSTKLPAQVCSVVDSFSINPPGTGDADTDSIRAVGAIAYSGGGIWVSCVSPLEQALLPINLYLYKFDGTGNKLDSIAYDFSDQGVVNAMTADDQYLWGIKSGIDSLFQFSTITRNLVATYSMGGRTDHEIDYTIASIGDSLYFIGANIGKCFKFSKSTTSFIDYPDYISNDGMYPGGMCAIGDSLFTNTYLNLEPALYLNDISIANPGTLTEDISSRQSWCLDIPAALAYGGGYFWQGKAIALTTDLREEYVYKIKSSLAPLGVSNITSPADFSVSPNPATNFINISCPGTSVWDSFTITIFTTTGQKVYSEKADNTTGKVPIDISRMNLAAGIYFVALNNGIQQIMKKIAVQ